MLRFINRESRYIPGVGGVEPPESPPLLVDRKPFITPPKFDDDEFLEEWFFELRDGFIWRRSSSLAGDGMKPTSEPSFTRRPIHQLLSYFSCEHQRNTNQLHGFNAFDIWSQNTKDDTLRKPLYAVWSKSSRNLNLNFNFFLRSSKSTIFEWLSIIFQTFKPIVSGRFPKTLHRRKQYTNIRAFLPTV